jgi:hypothetical protein
MRRKALNYLREQVGASAMIDAILQSHVSRELLNKIVVALLTQPKWDATQSARQTVADTIHAIIMGSDQ